MATNSTRLRTLAAGAAFVALSAPTAQAGNLADTPGALGQFEPKFSSNAAYVTKDNLARGAAGGIVYEIYNQLKTPTQDIKLVSFPPKKTNGVFVFYAVMPPTELQGKIPAVACLQKDGQPLYAWDIMLAGSNPGAFSARQVLYNPAGTSEKTPPCKATITAAWNEVQAEIDKSSQGAPEAVPAAAAVVSTNDPSVVLAQARAAQAAATAYKP